MMKTLLAILLMTLACACRSETSGQWREPMIPSLDWEERSDWTSVKTPKSWHGQTAKGDGVADDTSALQLTIAAADPMGGTVYLPPGRYRITDTLILGTLQESSATRPEGFSIIGHGRDTVIVWDGPEGMPMMRLMGISACRIVGVTFEGAGKASCVFDMGGPAFQGHNLFRHCAFLNTTKGGIVSGLRKMNTACTEQRIDNCLFENCGTGILLGDFNDYDCVIEGCEFRDCDYGVRTWHGMFYCRDCHFENSKKADFSFFSEHTSSIRRVSSLNANRFIEFRTPHTALVVQDCRVRGWHDPEGAIWHDILPAVVTDSTFTGRPGAETVFHFAHDPVEGEVPCNEGPNSQMYRVILRGNTLENARLHDGSQPVKFYEIPDDGAVKLSDFDASTSFLKTRAVRGVWTDDPRTACIPGKIFDVKRDFGAKGGEADDTASFKAAIQAAREHGRGAMVYIPRGHWTVRETLELEGGDYYFGGSGLRTYLSWYGPEGGTLIHLKPTGNIALEGFETWRAGGHKDGIDILHTGSPEDSGSLTIFDTVRVFGFLTPQPEVRGLRFRDLGEHDTVLSRGTFGNLRFTDSQEATFLFNTHYEGTVLVEGEQKERTGLTAFQFALLEICDPCLWIKDNNSLAMTDLYTEQNHSLYRFEGNGSSRRGRLSLGAVKVEQVPRLLIGYRGEITCCNPQYYCNALNGKSYFNNDSDCDIDYLEMASYYFIHSMRWNDNGGFRARFLAVGGGPADDLTVEEFCERTSDTSDEQAIAQAGRFFDDMRRVGELDLRLNHPGISQP